MVGRCDDLKCACQAAPKDPYHKPPPIKAALCGSHDHQVHQLDQPGVDIDVTFLPVERTMVIREKISGPEPRTMCCKTYIQLNSKNSTFVNLQGLPDNSLLLSIRIDKAGKDLKPQQKYRCYWPDHARGKLYADLVQCSWPQMTLHLVLPESRIKSWKTVALITRTFRRISADTWSWMVNSKSPPAVAGLNWREIEMGTK